MRSMRQIPIELEPPDHTDFRALVEPFFKRPDVPASIADMESLICSMVTEALIADQVDAVHDFALPLQCRALTRLLNVPESEADIWKEWGGACFNRGGGGIYCGTIFQGGGESGRRLFQYAQPGGISSA